MSAITSFSMFFLSFCPLWISVIFLDGISLWRKTKHPYTEAISIALIVLVGVLSLFSLLRIFNCKNTNGAQDYIISSAVEEKTITSEFLLSYILPLFSFDFTVWHDATLFLIFFVVFAFLCIRHNHFSVNIVLELMGYRFYRCELTNEDYQEISKVVISRSALNAYPNAEICIRPINNEYSLQISSTRKAKC